MEIKIIDAVYANSDDIKPVGNALRDENNKYAHCPKWNKGILYYDFESQKTKCTQCNYIK